MTARQYDVLVHGSRGHTSAQTAHLLGIRTDTVKWHRKDLYRELNVRTMAEAVAVAYQKGLLP